MEIRKAIGSIALAAAMGAHAQSTHIRETVDPYSNLRTLTLKISTRGCPGDPSTPTSDWDVHLIVSAQEEPDHRTLFFITPEIDFGSALSLPKKATMDTLIDDRVGRLTTQTGSTIISVRDGFHGSHLHETVPFAVDVSDLRILSGAHSFEFRVNGPRQTVQRCSDAKQMRELDEFIAAAKVY